MKYKIKYNELSDYLKTLKDNAYQKALIIKNHEKGLEQKTKHDNERLPISERKHE